MLTHGKEGQENNKKLHGFSTEKKKKKKKEKEEGGVKDGTK